ncbi:unnamed protein product, partial [Effrenium voratum]
MARFRAQQAGRRRFDEFGWWLVACTSPEIPTSALVECCDELSRARCDDFGLWRLLGDELAERLESRGARCPTALEAVSLLRSLAGVSCRHRKALRALELFPPLRQDLRPGEALRLLVACGQLRACEGLAPKACQLIA